MRSGWREGDASTAVAIIVKDVFSPKELFFHPRPSLSVRPQLSITADFVFFLELWNEKLNRLFLF